MNQPIATGSRVLVMLLFIVTTAWAEKGYPPASNKPYVYSEAEKKQCDSLFKLATELPRLEDRIELMRINFDDGKEYTKCLIDSALVWAIALKKPITEAHVHYDFFEYYESRGSKKGSAAVMAKIDSIATVHPSKESYYLHFRGWAGETQDLILSGQLEEAKFEALKMEQEAEKLNNNDGRFFSYYLSAYAYSMVLIDKNDSIALHFLKRAESLPNLSHLQQRWIQSRYYMYYSNLKAYDKVREALEKEALILEDELATNTQFKRKLLPMLLRNYVRMGALYNRQEELDSVKKYLEIAKRYFSEDIFYSSYVNYQREWAKYYFARGEWEKSIFHYDKAIEKGKNYHPLYLLTFHLNRAKALLHLGREEEAAILYQETVLRRDSLNKAMLLSHQKAHQENYKIKTLLKKQADRKRTLYQIGLLGILGVLIICLFVLIRMFQTESKIRKQQKRIKAAYAEVEKSNHLKDIFLKKIVQAIEEPLNNIVAYAAQLSNNQEVNQGKRVAYASEVKESSRKLLSLVLNVLEMSRLESGMMSFNCKEIDQKSICKEALASAKTLSNDKANIQIFDSAATTPLYLDTFQMQKVLMHLLLSPTQQYAEEAIEWHLFSENRWIVMRFKRSPLFLLDQTEQELIHQINAAILKELKGEYKVIREEKESTIELKLPQL